MVNVDQYIEKITNMLEGDTPNKNFVSALCDKKIATSEKVTVSNITNDVVKKSFDEDFFYKITAPDDIKFERKERVKHGRKDADQEFFQMTLISQIMMHEN